MGDTFINERKMSPAVYAYDPTSEFMKEPTSAPDNLLTSEEENDRISGIMPGSVDAFRVAKERTDLLCKLLEGVSESVQRFRPSKSLSNLNHANKNDEGNINDEGEYGESGIYLNGATSLASLTGSTDSLMEQMQQEEDVEIDIVLSGGGLKGYYMNGATYVLLKELKKRNIKIARVSGASAGSWAGAFLLCNFGAGNWLETYFACQVRPGSTLLGAYLEIWPQVSKLLPHNAWEICTDRLFISVTEITPWGLKNRIISKFETNRDLFEACCASSCIPYVTIPKIYWNLSFVDDDCNRTESIFLDGGITNNTPVFPDGNNRQLVFRLFEVEYPWRQMVNPTDTCIETLCLRGAILMSRFLQGEPTDSIQWLDRKQKKEELVIKKNYMLRLLILPFVVGGLIVGRGTGISPMLRTLFKKAHINTVLVPFAEAGRYYGTSTINYVGTILFTTMVDGLRTLQLLL